MPAFARHAPARSIVTRPPARGAWRALRTRRARQGGFNFTEVLFAVMILGIGFIMVAAIFPVALLQSKTTQEESAAAAIARGGANYIEQIATDAIMPETGGVVRSLDQLRELRGTLMVTADSRYAWIPFYRRGAGSPFAQVYMLPVAVRNESSYSAGPPPVIGTGPAGGARNADMTATVYDSTVTVTPPNTDGVDIIEFPADASLNYQAVAEGSYVIIASSPELPATGQPARVGHIFRIGAATESQPAGPYPRRWSLVPGSDYVPRTVELAGPPVTYVTPLSLDNVAVFVIGRANLEGLGQDVAAYTTFVAIRP